MVHSTAQYFEKRIDELERRVFHLQMQVEKISRNNLLSDRHLGMNAYSTDRNSIDYEEL